MKVNLLLVGGYEMVVKQHVGRSYYFTYDEKEFMIKELMSNKNYGYWDGKEEELCEKILDKLNFVKKETK